MAITHTRDMDPRIRILSCDAPEAPRRRRDWRLPVAAAGVAVLGVGVTLAVTTTQRPEPALSQAEPAAPVVVQPPQQRVVVMASASVASYRPTRALHTSIRMATNADLHAAAKAAKPDAEGTTSATAGTGTTTAPVQTITDSAPRSTVPRGTSTDSNSTPKAPTTPKQVPNSTSNTPTTTDSNPATTTIGPENAPGPGDPVSPQ